MASINFKVSKVHHGGDQSRTATYAGKGNILGNAEVKSVWITARHGGMVAGTEVILQIGKTTIEGSCVFDDQYSDVAIIAGIMVPTLSDEGQLIFSRDLAQGKLVGILGFPSNSDPNLGTATLSTGYVASTTAGARMPGLPAEAAQWRNQRFFLVDKNCDFGVSGGPIVDVEGCVVGMLCASCTNYSQVSWALLSSYMCDALDSVGVEWVN